MFFFIIRHLFFWLHISILFFFLFVPEWNKLSMMIMRSAKTVWPMDMDIEWKYFSLQNRNRNFFLSYYLEFLVYGSDSSSSLLLLLSVCLYVCYLDTFGQFGFKFPYFFFACCAAVFFSILAKPVSTKLLLLLFIFDQGLVVCVWSLFVVVYGSIIWIFDFCFEIFLRAKEKKRT